jgi:bacteriochlorophyll 4-vinyl reductase
MNVVLAAAQTVAGSQYHQLVKAAGLARWAETLPPPTMEGVATEAELSRLFSTVYTMLGESGTRLMMRNWGTTLAPMIIAIPQLRAMVTEVAALPAAARLPQAILRLQESTSMFWSPATLTEDANAWYVTLGACPVCAEIRGAQMPICTNLEAIFPRMVQAFAGQRLTVQETACRATGAPACVYTIYKPGLIR